MFYLDRMTHTVKLNQDEYRDKVYACWIGKNIGGTMGTPYEGQRKIQDIQGFVTKENEVLPNDDLDLQLVWLHAVEELGPKGVNEKTLGEQWVSFVTPHWNEYGIGKVNMKHGILPPCSGDYNNNWKDSNGAWIRTEIWATLAPASPDIAIQYAYYDACVDHGTAEGTVAAIFVGAIESAAFVVKDFRKLLEIGLSKIPTDSRVARSVRLVMDYYDRGIDWKETREAILKENADIGDGWFEAPSNVAYVVLGILYGQCDFKKSMILAINCGDDTDCTGATVGSILGIMGGMAAIPEDWRKHLGDDIVTISIAKGTLYGIPKTCTELTEHVVRMAPVMLAEHLVHQEAFHVELSNEATSIDEEAIAHLADGAEAKKLLEIPAYSTTFDFAYATATVYMEDGPEISPLQTKRIHVKFVNNHEAFGCMSHYLNVDWILPDGWDVTGPKSIYLPQFNSHYNAKTEVVYELTAGEEVDAVNRLIMECIGDGRPTPGLIPVVVMGV